MTVVRGVERNLSNKVKGFLDAFQKREVYVYYPIATKACVACGVNIAQNMLRCPHCGIIQPVNQPSAAARRGEADLPVVDKRVFDYIVAHNGTISVSQAARELSLSQELLQESIDRLKSSGLLNPA